jgi:uncharacterized membrane protein
MYKAQRHKTPRIESIDALRGLSVALMVVHHALFDAVEFLGAPAWLFSNPVFDALHYLFAGVFIFLAGVSSRFSRSNLKRGLLTAAAAVAVSLATAFIGAPVRFGVLHLLASCMLLYAAFGRAIERASKSGKLAAAIVWFALLVLSALAVKYLDFGASWLWPFGWTYAGFYSSDYFPLLPWVFVFLLGAAAGEPIKDGRLPPWFYTVKTPFFPALGRRALWIYLLHQPALYGVTQLVLRLRG